MVGVAGSSPVAPTRFSKTPVYAGVFAFCFLFLSPCLLELFDLAPNLFHGVIEGMVWASYLQAPACVQAYRENMTRPVIHFAHSNGFVSACYAKFLRELEKDFEVKVVKALGLDPRFPVDNNWASLTEQVRDSIASQSSAPVIGLGHSLGGMTSYMCAYQYPELFKALIMLDPPIINGMGAAMMGMAKFFGQVDRVTPAGKSLGRREVWPSREAAYEALRPKRLFRDFDEDCFRDYMSFGLTDTADGVRLTLPAATEVEIFRHTPSNAWAFKSGPLPMPAAVVTGAQSDFNEAGFVDRLARKHQMRRLMTPGGHMFPLEHPIATAQFVKGVIADMQVA